jgi:hypothetical protein
MSCRLAGMAGSGVSDGARLIVLRHHRVSTIFAPLTATAHPSAAVTLEHRYRMTLRQAPRFLRSGLPKFRATSSKKPGGCNGGLGTRHYIGRSEGRGLVRRRYGAIHHPSSGLTCKSTANSSCSQFMICWRSLSVR